MNDGNGGARKIALISFIFIASFLIGLSFVLIFPQLAHASLINVCLVFLMIFLHFTGLVLFYYFFGVAGLFAFVPLAIIIANIQVLKLVDIFSFTTALGNAAYSSTFLISDILAENYGKKAAKRSVMIGFFSLFFFSFIMYLTTLFVPSADDFSDIHLKSLFTLVPRMAFAGLLTYYVSQTFDVFLYLKIKQYFPRFLFVRNLSSIISQFIDTCLFSFLAFGFSLHWGWIEVKQLYPWSVIWEIILVAYFFKGMMSLFSTPYLYIAKWMKSKNHFFNEEK